MPLPPERMSRVDTAWLRMDTPANLMMIVGVWLLRPQVARDTVAQRVQATLLQYNRFRQKVVEDAMGALWVEDPALDLAHHVKLEALPLQTGQSAEAALKGRVAVLAAQPLEPARPLWQFHVVEDLGGELAGHSALIVRIHHCIADGIALMSVTLSIADGGAAPPQRRSRKASADDTPGHADDWLGRAVLEPLTDLTVKALGLYGSGVAKSMDMLANPAQPLLGSLDMAKMAMQVVQDAAAMALMADDSPTRLKGKARPAKRVAWGPLLPLEQVKAVAKALGVSVNDVLLGCVAGAIGSYLQAQGDDTSGQELRAMVPVNLRPLDQAWKLGNRFGLVPLTLPIGLASPIERVYTVHQRMAELKGSTQPLLAFAVLAVAGLLIKPAQDALLGLFAKKATAVMTNVPGPTEPLRFCGSTVERVLFWVPQSGDMGMGVSILSYAGGVQFGLITDATLCPEPQEVIDRFIPEFDKLLWLALMLPAAGEV